MFLYRGLKKDTSQTHTHTPQKRQKRNLIYTVYIHEIEQQSSIECILLVVKQTMLNNDLALLVMGYAVRWLKYYCTFRMTHTCNVRHMYTRNRKKTCSCLISTIVEGESQQNDILNTMIQAIQSKGDEHNNYSSG